MITAQVSILVLSAERTRGSVAAVEHGQRGGCWLAGKMRRTHNNKRTRSRPPSSSPRCRQRARCTASAFPHPPLPFYSADAAGLINGFLFNVTKPRQVADLAQERPIWDSYLDRGYDRCLLIRCERDAQVGVCVAWNHWAVPPLA